MLRIRSKYERDLNGKKQVLRISENAKGLRGTLMEGGKRIGSAIFQGKEATDFRVLEYFNFSLSTAKKIL